MRGHGEKLTRKQEQAIAALLAEPTLSAAACRCGVSESTLYRWVHAQSFQAAYRSARRSVVDAAIGHLQQAAADAVGCLRRNLACGTPGVEVRAAAVILEQVLGALDRLE